MTEQEVKAGVEDEERDEVEDDIDEDEDVDVDDGVFLPTFGCPLVVVKIYSHRIFCGACSSD